ncbi:cupin domain-containing protein [Pseudoclavibacter chungangensis]|uniref:Cupin domain-containing protein n=1 Tax=Pseudoclavibacter chungangensis TaxID=587635 RepID=A0A7J5C062_9MICO|nr:cupin domain-containing protein [Pseudoclavibacter chungangensis]KAB1660294.1 cupin domain-containing protein [Pseudoclavibacter chungangensis]NYJ65643.1 mannose-6-phosphate isomerase-like protein (cupin superfamily) [Pseudoclavibacter chungangensis]
MTGSRSITETLERSSAPWQPHLVAQVNSTDVKLVNLLGEFVWHTHPESDELFLVLHGHLTIELRDGNVELGPNELFVVPRGIEHRPRADAEVHALLVEAAGTVNTGDAGGDLTAELHDARSA